MAVVPGPGNWRSRGICTRYCWAASAKLSAVRSEFGSSSTLRMAASSRARTFSYKATRAGRSFVESAEATTWAVEGVLKKGKDKFHEVSLGKERNQRRELGRFQRSICRVAGQLCRMSNRELRRSFNASSFLGLRGVWRRDAGRLDTQRTQLCRRGLLHALCTKQAAAAVVGCGKGISGRLWCRTIP